MRSYLRIPSVNLAPSAIDSLAAIVPEGRSGDHYFGCKLEVTDPRLSPLLHRLGALGLSPHLWQGEPFDERRHFYVALDREWEHEDLIDIPAMRAAPPSDACNPGVLHRLDSGELMIPERSMPPASTESIFSGLPSDYFVTRETKTLLECGRWRGIRFRPTFFIPDDDTVEPACGEASPYWELDAEPVRPDVADDPRPVAPVTADERELTIEDIVRLLEAKDQCVVSEACATAVAQLDIVRAVPAKARAGAFDSRLIVSSRFYQFCHENGLKTSWVPATTAPPRPG